MALARATQEIIWLKRILKDLTIHEEKTSCIKQTGNDRFSSETKHIDTKYHFIKDHVKKGTIVCTHCPTGIMVADLMTKPLTAKRFQTLRDDLGLCN